MIQAAKQATESPSSCLEPIQEKVKTWGNRVVIYVKAEFKNNPLKVASLTLLGIGTFWTGWAVITGSLSLLINGAVILLSGSYLYERATTAASPVIVTSPVQSDDAD